MTALDLLHQLQVLGVVLTPYPDETLRYKAPKGVLTPTLLDAMRQHKAELHGLVEGFEERSSIAEYCGSLSRLAAEALAWQSVFGETPAQPRRTAVPVSRGDDDATREQCTTTQLSAENGLHGQDWGAPARRGLSSGECVSR